MNIGSFFKNMFSDVKAFFVKVKNFIKWVFSSGPVVVTTANTAKVTLTPLANQTVTVNIVVPQPTTPTSVTPTTTVVANTVVVPPQNTITVAAQ